MFDIILNKLKLFADMQVDYWAFEEQVILTKPEFDYFAEQIESLNKKIKKYENWLLP